MTSERLNFILPSENSFIKVMLILKDYSSFNYGSTHIYTKVWYSMLYGHTRKSIQNTNFAGLASNVRGSQYKT